MTIESICFTTLAIIVVLVSDALWKELKVWSWSSWSLLTLAFIGLFYDALHGTYYGFYLLLLVVALNITGGSIRYILHVGQIYLDKTMHDMTH